MILLVLLTPSFAVAGTGEKFKLAEELLELMKVEQSLSDYISQYKQTMASFIDKMDLGDIEKDHEQKQYAKMTDFVEKEMSWKKMKPDFVNLYSPLAQDLN
jgi:hypothetical protein